MVSHIARIPRETQHLSTQITLHNEDVAHISAERITPQAVVIADQTSLSLFNKKPGRWVWNDLEDEAKKNFDHRWIKQLARAIYSTSKRETAAPIFATFTARQGNKIYQPILYRVEWERDASMKFDVMFHEEVSWRLSEIQGALAVLQTAQTMALRFRYEVLCKYANRLEVKRANGSPDVRLELSEVIQSIEQEAASRGLFEEHKLLNVFALPERGKIAAMYTDWYAIRPELNHAIENSRMEDVNRCLARLSHHNNAFIPMAASGYKELTSEIMEHEASLSSEDAPSPSESQVRKRSKERHSRSSLKKSQ
jgi:hypothetical protein